MMIRLHHQATTIKPKIRAVFQASNEAASTLAKRYNISELTVSKWQKRDGIEDHSHIPNRLQTTLSPVQKVVAIFLRKTLFLSLDYLLSVVREFLNPSARSGLDCCLHQHWIRDLQDIKQVALNLHVYVKYLPQMPNVWLYNQELPQSVLASRNPVQSMKDWYNLNFSKKEPYYLPGYDSLVCHGSWFGEITRQPYGTSGFVYNSVFMLAGRGRIGAGISTEENQAFFHRDQALAYLLDSLRHA